MTLPCPSHDCFHCPRLADFRNDNRKRFPDKFNGPVPSWGPDNAKLLIVGLAPGLRGANFTGRPFTGDWAGDLLYATLLEFGLAKGQYKEDPNDGLQLIDCRITNAVRCVPPENKPIGEEINNCQPFLKGEIDNLKNLKAILSLGLVSHNAVLRVLKKRVASYKFAHGAVHDLGDGITLYDSYHCSRYNTNTRRLTEDMFKDVFKKIKKDI